jgi:hypothetical protein
MRLVCSGLLGLTGCLLLAGCSQEKAAQPPADAKILDTFAEFLLTFDELRNGPPPPKGTDPNYAFPGFFKYFYEMDEVCMMEVGRVASGYAKAAAALDAKAEATMKTKWTPAWARALRDGKRLPDFPAELARIQAEKDKLTRAAIEDLETALGLAQVRYLRYELTGRPLRNFYEH